MFHATRVIATGILFSGMLLNGCDGPAGKEGPARPASQPAPKIEIVTARAEALAERIPIVGTLFPAEDALIATKASGVLRRTFVDVSSVVKPDDPLAQVDQQDYQFAVAQAEAAQAAVLARLGTNHIPDASFDLNTVSAVQRAAAEFENARFTHDRMVRLGEQMSAVSEQELNDVRTRLHVAQAELQLAIEEAAALVASSRERRSELELAQQRLADALTRTPPIPSTLGREGADEWIVAARLVTEGQYVKVGDPLYRLIIRDPLKLRSQVPERYADVMRVGQPVELEARRGEIPTQGQILRISPAVDPVSRTFEIEALIANPTNTHLPGVFAKGAILTAEAAPVIRVPAAAIVRTGGAASLFVVTDSIARRRPVRLGRELDRRIEIVEGLREGERYVAVGVESVSDGSPVAGRNNAP